MLPAVSTTTSPIENHEEGIQVYREVVRPLECRFRRPLWGLCAAFLISLCAPGATAQAETVAEVAVQYIGAETVDRSVILSHIRTKPGTQLDSSVLDEDIKSLRKSGHVEYIRILKEPAAGGTRVIYLVQTRATLGEIVFIGNSLPSAKLRKQTELVIGTPFDDSDIEEARVALSEHYNSKGFANVGISYKVDSADQPGFSRVSFIIDEGRMERLNKITFFGNEALSDRQLADQMMVRERKAYQMFNRNKGIDSAVLEEDVIRIEEFYRDNGYLTARVTDLQRQPAGDKVDLAIYIDEGVKYSVSTVSVTGIKAVDEAEVLSRLEMQPGSIYSSKGIKTDLKGLRKYYANNGYSGVRVMPRITSAGGSSVNIEYDVAEGVQSTVELINIGGNEKTLDKVIRRELALAPGDVYNQDMIEVSKNRLLGLGYFDAVDITPTQAAASPNHTDLNIDVREKSTGSINFGAGFSSIDNLVGFIDLVQTNFKIRGKPHTGAGQKLRISMKVGTQRKDLQIDFTEPWMFDKQLAFSTGAYYRDLLFLSDKYDERRIGAYVGLRKPLGEHTYLTGKLTFENYDISVDSDASERLLEEEGSYSRVLGELTYVWDTRDSQYLTRSGHRVSVGLEGSVGDSEYVGFNLAGSKFWSLPLDTIFSLSGSYRSVDGDVPIFDRLFMGGANDLRGYGFREATGLGLRDEQGEPLGGNSSAFFTAEYSFPIFDVRKLRGHVFYDGGMLSESAWDFGGDYLSDFGFGIDLYLPVGPIRVDLAIPLQKDEFTEDDFRVQFNMGYKF